MKKFALKAKANPIGVAEYQLQGTLPAEFKGKLPTAKQLADVAREFYPRRKRLLERIIHEQAERTRNRAGLELGNAVTVANFGE